MKFVYRNSPFSNKKREVTSYYTGHMYYWIFQFPITQLWTVISAKKLSRTLETRNHSKHYAVLKMDNTLRFGAVVVNYRDTIWLVQQIIIIESVDSISRDGLDAA